MSSHKAARVLRAAFLSERRIKTHKLAPPIAADAEDLPFSYVAYPFNEQ